MAARTHYLVDASIYIFRAYFSLPDQWRSPEGYSLNAVYGYTSFLMDLLAKLGETGSHQLAVGFDESLGSCFRNSIYPDYKVRRELPDEGLAYQLNACRRVTDLLGMACFAGPEYEADDYIASLARRARLQGDRVVVVTRDKDLGQVLLGAKDTLWDFAAGQKMDREAFYQRFGVAPEQFADYQGLVGDSIDDIPGVPGVGAKTGARLIQAFGDLETLEPRRAALDGLGIRGAARISENLFKYWEQALISRQLARLADDIDGLATPAPYQLQAANVAQLCDYLDSIQLRGPVINRARALRRQLLGAES